MDKSKSPQGLIGRPGLKECGVDNGRDHDYWDVDDVLKEASLNNHRNTFTVVRANELDDIQSSNSSSDPASNECWEMDGALSSVNLAKVAGLLKPNSPQPRVSREIMSIANRSTLREKQQLKTGMIYRLSSTHPNIEGIVNAVWNGTQLVPVDPTKILPAVSNPIPKNGTSNPKKYMKLVSESNSQPQITVTLLKNASPKGSSQPLRLSFPKQKLKQTNVLPNSTSQCEAHVEQLGQGQELREKLDQTLPAGEFKVCGNCGGLSKKTIVCEACGKPLSQKDKTFKKNPTDESHFYSKSTTSPETNLIDKQKFYRHKLTEQFKVYSPCVKEKATRHRRTRRPDKRKAQPETVVLSSDEEDPNSDSTPNTPGQWEDSQSYSDLETNTQQSGSNNCILQTADSTFKEGRTADSVRETTVKGDYPVPQDSANLSFEDFPDFVSSTKPHLKGSRIHRMEDASGNIPGVKRKVQKTTERCEEELFILSLSVPIVRLGLVTGTPLQPITASKEGFVIHMKIVTYADDAVKFDIYPRDIENIAYCLEDTLPVIFLNPSQTCGHRLRTELNITEELFAPGTTDCRKKFVTFQLEKGLDEDEPDIVSLFENFQRLKPHAQNFIQQLTIEEAQNVLVQTSTPVNSPSGHDDTPDDPSPPPAAKMMSHSNESLFVYKTPEEKGGITVTTEDFHCLSEGEFLNDVIIDFYLKYLLNEVLSKEMRSKTYIFSSFFYNCLTQKPSKFSSPDKQLSLKERRHKNVKNWTRRVDIFSKDFIVVPINEHSHWFLAIICYPGMLSPTCPMEMDSTSSKEENTPEEEEDEAGTVEMTDDSINQSQPKNFIQPCILVFDSLSGSPRTTVVRTLREYLSVEWKTKKKTERVFDRCTVRGAYPKVPQQNNYSDCGIYLLQYVESFFENPIGDFSIPVRGLTEWFTLDKVSKKREEIKNLILTMKERLS